jgi:hypothetical protein
VAFFGASLAFGAVQRLTAGESVAVTLAAQVVVLAALVGLIVLVVRRRR